MEIKSSRKVIASSLSCAQNKYWKYSGTEHGVKGTVVFNLLYLLRGDKMQKWTAK